MKQYVPSVSDVYSAIFKNRKTVYALYVVLHPKSINIVATAAIILLIRLCRADIIKLILGKYLRDKKPGECVNINMVTG